MTIRCIIALFSLFLIISCSEQTELETKEYTLPLRKGEVLVVIQELANEAKIWKSTQDAPNNGGHVYIDIITRESQANLTDSEWLKYCVSIMFSSLGHPIKDTEKAMLAITKNPKGFTLTHNEEAIIMFDKLFIRWQKTPEERFRDLLYPTN